MMAPLPYELLEWLPSAVRHALAHSLGDDPVSPGADVFAALPFDRLRPTNAHPWRRLRAEAALAPLGFTLGVADDGVHIGLLDDDAINRQSAGRVSIPETFVKRTGRADAKGLHCERTFGTSRNSECYCGKYAGDKHIGVTCDRCGVEVVAAAAALRYRRVGHIELSSPMVPWWLVHGDPSPLAVLCDRSADEVFEALDVTFMHHESAEHSIDVLRPWLPDAATAAARLAALPPAAHLARLVLAAWCDGRLNVDQLTTRRLAVLPAGFRAPDADHPHHLDDLYARTINRANRVARLEELNAPMIILRNERRMLQEVIWQLQANEVCRHAATSRVRRLQSVAAFAASVLDPPPGDLRARHTVEVSLVCDPRIADDRATAPPAPPGAPDAPDTVVAWPTTRPGHARVLARASSLPTDDNDTTTPVIRMSPRTAAAMHLTAGQPLALFMPPGLSAALQPLVGHGVEVTPASAVAPSPDVASLFAVLTMQALSGEPLPFTPSDALLLCGVVI